jgi:hypothetical protein
LLGLTGHERCLPPASEGCGYLRTIRKLSVTGLPALCAASVAVITAR